MNDSVIPAVPLLIAYATSPEKKTTVAVVLAGTYVDDLRFVNLEVEVIDYRSLYNYL
jgi:hypothetical protein